MKIAVIGANGQLGSDVVKAFTANGDEVVPLTHSDIELSNTDSVSERLRQLRPAMSWSIRRQCITWKSASRNRKKLLP